MDPVESNTLNDTIPGTIAQLSSRVAWRDGMAFDASLDGFTLPLDAGPEAGGVGHGPRPKGLVLTALCGCTAMDVVAMLRKMRVPIESLVVTADGALAPTHPRYFVRIELHYDFTGTDLSLEKLERAVNMSLQKFCAVAAMLQPTAHIAHTIRINGAARLRVDETTVSFVPEAD